MRWAGKLSRNVRIATVFLLVGAGFPASSAATEGNPEILARSIYVPLRIEAAPCLREVVVRSEDGGVRAVVPGRLIAQFAFHEGHEGPSPPWERLTVEGWIAAGDGDGKEEPRPFRTGIVITPTSIYVGPKRVDLATLDRMGRFRRRVDLRVPERTLRLRPRECAEALREGGRRPGPSAPS